MDFKETKWEISLPGTNTFSTNDTVKDDLYDKCKNMV